MFETYESPYGETFHLVPDSDLHHMKDHMIGIIQQLYQSTFPDKDLLQFNLEEIACVLGIRLPSNSINLGVKC